MSSTLTQSSKELQVEIIFTCTSTRHQGGSVIHRAIASLDNLDFQDAARWIEQG